MISLISLFYKQQTTNNNNSVEWDVYLLVNWHILKKEKKKRKKWDGTVYFVSFRGFWLNTARILRLCTNASYRFVVSTAPFRKNNLSVSFRSKHNITGAPSLSVCLHSWRIREKTSQEATAKGKTKLTCSLLLLHQDKTLGSEFAVLISFSDRECLSVVLVVVLGGIWAQWRLRKRREKRKETAALYRISFSRDTLKILFFVTFFLLLFFSLSLFSLFSLALSFVFTLFVSFLSFFSFHFILFFLLSLFFLFFFVATSISYETFFRERLSCFIWSSRLSRVVIIIIIIIVVFFLLREASHAFFVVY